MLFGDVGEDDFGEVRSEFEHLKFDSSALYTLQFGLLINPDCQIRLGNCILRVEPHDMIQTVAASSNLCINNHNSSCLDALAE